MPVDDLLVVAYTLVAAYLFIGFSLWLYQVIRFGFWEGWGAEMAFFLVLVGLWFPMMVYVTMENRR